MTIINVTKILEDIKDVKIGIIGDFCLDLYLHYDDNLREISLETGLPTFSVKSQTFSLGGASNVANNLKAIGVKDVRVFGVTGNDPFGHRLRSLLKEIDIDEDGLLTQEDQWATNTFTKPIYKNSELNRIDFGNFNEVSEENVSKLIKKLEESLKTLDLVIINQQLIKGIHNNVDFRDKLQQIIDNHSNKKFIIDSRHFGGSYSNIIHKMTATEAAQLCDCAPTVAEYSKLYQKLQKTVFVTKGANGCDIVSENGTVHVSAVTVDGKIDTVGAGDSMLSGISVCLAANYDPETAAIFGSLVAGVTVQKLFITGTATPKEIIELAENERNRGIERLI